MDTNAILMNTESMLLNSGINYSHNNLIVKK